ncbi:MAG: bacterioferritin-associated ferredoxin [Bdellovibrionia bacterium]
MWVCICHALTDKDIEAAEAQGAKTELEVYAHYGVKPQCGRCVPTVKCLMKCQNKAPICQAIAEVTKISQDSASTDTSDSDEVIELDKASSF